MPVIDEHVEQVSVEGYVFTVEPRRNQTIELSVLISSSFSNMSHTLSPKKVDSSNLFYY